MERLTFIRSISVTSAFFVCWSPEFVLVLFEYLTGTSAALEHYLLSGSLVIIHAVLNPLLILYLDKHIQSCVLEFLNIHPRPTVNHNGPSEPESITEIAPVDT